MIALSDSSGQLARPRFPAALVLAIERVARDFNLPDDWLNAAVGAQWHVGLPDGLADDLEWRVFRGLRVGLVGRATLIALKLFAAVDKGPGSVHLQDLLVLAPTDEEFTVASTWVTTQDIAAEWPQFVKEVVDHVCAQRRRS